MDWESIDDKLVEKEVGERKQSDNPEWDSREIQ